MSAEIKFIDLIHKELKGEANDSEIMILEADPENWRNTLVYEIKKIDDEIASLRAECWASGYKGKMRWETERVPLGIRKRRFQKKIEELNIIRKEENARKEKERFEKEKIKQPKETINYGVELLKIQKELAEIKSILTNRTVEQR